MSSIQLETKMESNGETPTRAEKFNEGRWTKDEHQTFVQGLELHGKEWKKIAKLIPSRSIVQIRTHAQKFFQKVARVNFEKKGIQVPDALKSTAIKSSYNFEALQTALNEHTPEEEAKSKSSNLDFANKLFLQEADNEDSSASVPSSSGSIDSRMKIDRTNSRATRKSKARVSRRRSQYRAKSSSRNRAPSGGETIAGLMALDAKAAKVKTEPRKARRTSRKSSKYSIDLHQLTLNASDDEQEPNAFKLEYPDSELNFEYGGNVAPQMNGFSFSTNHFSTQGSGSTQSSRGPSPRLNMNRADIFGFEGALNPRIPERQQLKKAKSCNSFKFGDALNMLPRTDLHQLKEQESNYSPLLDMDFDCINIIDSLDMIAPSSTNNDRNGSLHSGYTRTSPLDGIDENDRNGDYSDTTSTHSVSNISVPDEVDPLLEFINSSFGNMSARMDETQSHPIQ